MGAGQSDLYKNTYGDNADNIPEDASKGTQDGKSDVPVDVNNLTHSQRKSIKTIENTIRDHLTEKDFSGALRDIEGNPVPRGGGRYYDHLQEMRFSYQSLTKELKSLYGSLQNPNLGEREKIIITETVQRAEIFLERIKEILILAGEQL